jgi:tetratricopeptide (TPR) repeat protein
MRREVAMAQGQFPGALAVVEEGLAETDPEIRARSQAETVPLLRLLGRWQEAERAATQAAQATIPFDRDMARRLALFAGLEGGLAEAYLLGRTEEGRAKVDAALARNPLDSLPPERRPYLSLIYAEAILGRVDRARAWLAQYRRVATAADSADVISAEAMIAYGEERWPEAIALLRRGAAGAGWFCRTCGLVQIGEAFDRQGMTDSARVAYEAYATDLAAGHIGQDTDLPISYIRLGEIYEAQGDRERALEYYNKLLDLWKDADPLLQPKVRDIRERVGRLAGEGSGR